MKPVKKILFSLSFFVLLSSCISREEIKISGEMKTWHKVTLDIPGPGVSEQSIPNPFLDYRLEVTFTNGGERFVVPGYFAADGNASETSSESGSVWRVHFTPDRAGTWHYAISFRKGRNITVSADTAAGVALDQDGKEGIFEVTETDKSGKDFRAKGRLKTTGGHYLQHSGSGEYFIKGGADSPENLLGYVDFDGTYYGGNKENRTGEAVPNTGLHAYEPHIKDWHEGDPAWQDKKGKGIIGGLNYLSSKGMNSVYFLTLNIMGDGEDVWPYTDRNERYRFDCSKLDQWEIVFSHMDRVGIMLHVVLQETENEQILDGGYLDVQRKLYLRELVARFSHHLAITWNLGEEHGPMKINSYGQSIKDTRKMADYLRDIDPYDHFIAMHTNASEKMQQNYLPNYLAYPSINGPSIQVGNPLAAHRATLKWIRESEAAGQNWVVCIDEIGQAWKGALPDSHDPAHDTIREHVLWGNLMAGGAGVEWYFGYRYPHNDLNLEDWRSRDILWDQTRFAQEFFQGYLPFFEMVSMDSLVSDGMCFAIPGEIYAIYFPGNSERVIEMLIGDGSYSVDWYNPREGGDLQKGSIEQLKPGRRVSPGDPPDDADRDWVCLLKIQQ